MKRLAEHRDNAESVINHAGFSFLFVRNLTPISVDELQHHSAVIVEAKNVDFVRLMVNAIRSNNSPDVYLKPVYLLSKDSVKDNVLSNLIDGSIKSLSGLDEIIPSLERISTRAQDLTFTNSISFEAQMLTKLITLLYIKEQKTVEPIPSVYSSINYSYPLLSVNFDSSEEHVALRILKIAEDEGILRSEYFDRVYLCSGCSGSRLSYREVCPKCSSSNTTPDDIVHHFPCGYVGPMKDYANEIDDKLDCPKCNKRLRHIGVDYDKPSIIHECNNCNHKFQDYYVYAKCLSCEADKPVENLIPTDIKSYRLTKKGELAAIKGFVTTTKDIDEVVGTIKYETFKVMLKYEIERLKQTESNSNICAINIANSSQVYSKLGSEMQRSLLKDIITVIRGNIRSSDIIAFESSETIVLSMNDTPHKAALRIVDDIIALLNDLIKTSFDDLDVLFDTRVLPIELSKTPENLLKDLLIEFS